jgi:CO/xanthine dehydrogenase Mo-binding subunit
LGELSMEGPAPAIANAVAMAIGRRPDRLPIDPGSILDATEAFDR